MRWRAGYRLLRLELLLRLRPPAPLDFCLFTVRAAISFARPVLIPRRFADFLIYSYFRFCLRVAPLTAIFVPPSLAS